jgi:hypothetical protein
MKKGPISVGMVAPGGFNWDAASTCMLIPIESERAMNSFRPSLVTAAARARKPIKYSHSDHVTFYSRKNA